MSGGVDLRLLHLAPQPVASIVVPDIGPTAVAAALHGALPDVFTHLQASGVVAAGPPFARYHHRAGDRLDLEVGLPVDGPFPPTDEILARELPGGDALVATHVGSYDDLAATVGAMVAWCTEHGRVPAGGHWEYYVDDPSAVPAADVRTRLVLPVT